AHLRRVGLPLDDIRTVVTEPAQAGSVLAAHLVRLEAGLADARREISIVHHLLENTETPMYRCTLSATAFVNALREVRYAVCDDPDQPRLHGVYLDSEPGRVRVVATDRYRLATGALLTSEETDLHLLLPTAAVDELLAADLTGSLDVVVNDGTVTLTSGGWTVQAQVPDVDFPSYRAFLEHGRQEVAVDAVALRAELETGTTTTLTREGDAVVFDVSLLSIGERGVRVGATDEPDALVVAVNREFLLQALQAGNQLTLGLDDPIAPLAIRNPHREGAVSILMPVRLDQPA
ncbi:MAG: hypothetical protein ABIQ53_15880, partial [Terracoccus sp.]